MSAPAWLLDAIHATESVSVPSVPITRIHPWVQEECHSSHVDIELSTNVPTVPNEPNEINLCMDEFGVATTDERLSHSNDLAELIKRGGTAWLWQVHLPDRTLSVATSPASTVAEMQEMYPAASLLEAIE